MSTTYFSIEIFLQPELINGMPHFFWCILENNEKVSTNKGFGWSKSVIAAFSDANFYYEKNITIH